jgi:glucose-6-phosphate isomerase
VLGARNGELIARCALARDEGNLEMPEKSDTAATRPAWKALAAHYEAVRGLHLRTLFADDAARGERLTVDAVGITLDYSKNRITDETVTLLRQLADESGVRARADAMFRG